MGLDLAKNSFGCQMKHASTIGESGSRKAYYRMERLEEQLEALQRQPGNFEPRGLTKEVNRPSRQQNVNGSEEPREIV